VKRTEQLLELDRNWMAILEGKAKLGSPVEQAQFAAFCVAYKGRPRAAVGFFIEAFRAEPRLADDLRVQYRYNAACAAVLAAAGQGLDAGKLDVKERERFRKQALDWLQADLARYTRDAENANPNLRRAIQQRLTHWQQDRDLGPVREEKPLAAFSETERAAWRKLWADVAALRNKVALKG
jgi:serine/threonine-protein kinase